MTDEIRHGPWRIYYDPPPIPIRTCDWQFVHDDYDGAPDAHDSRHGSAASVEDAIFQIEEIEEMVAEGREMAALLTRYAHIKHPPKRGGTQGGPDDAL